MNRTQIEALLMLAAGHARRGFKSDAASRLGLRRPEISNNLNQPSLAFLKALRDLLARDEAEGRAPDLQLLDAASAHIAWEARRALDGHLDASRAATARPYWVLMTVQDLDEARLRSLHADGLDSRAIADAMGVPWVTVIEWYAEHPGLRPHPLRIPKGGRPTLGTVEAA